MSDHQQPPAGPTATAAPAHGFRTVNPATGKAGTVQASMTDADLHQLVSAAADAQAAWARTPLGARCNVVRRAAALHRERRDHLASLIVAEMGKPITQALGEVDLTADIYQYYADHGQELLRDQPLPLQSGTGHALVRKSPLGPLLGVMPWNYPAYQIARFAAPNLVAGNSVLVKPAPQCPDTAAAIQALLADAGIPVGVSANLWIDHQQVEAVIAHPAVRGVSFTGSHQAGAKVAEAAGRHLKKVVLELGGSDPFLVLDTRDLKRAVAAGVASRLENNGQACNAAKRFIILSQHYDAFLDMLLEAMAPIRPGDPRMEDTVLGPLSSIDAAQRLERQVAAAIADGATLRLGGTRHGAFFAPTVITDVTPQNRAHREEFFGPVVMVYCAADEDHAVSIANDTPFGLGSYIFTDDPTQARRVSDRVDAGMVFINGVALEAPELPFGGTKNSGFGRELGPLGISEFLNMKLIRSATPAESVAQG